MLEIKNLLVKLDGISIEIKHLVLDRGDYLAVMGITGAGKTVLLETIAGFHKPIKGTIMIDGENITNMPPQKRSISIVYQDYMLFPHLTVRENIEFGLRMRGIHDEKLVRNIARELGIDHLMDRYPRNLSGGEKQRVAIARALVTNPKLLLLDEPFAALDVKTAEKTKMLVKKIVEERGLTTIHVTHKVDDAVTLAKKILVMKSGKVVQFGTVEEVLLRPKDEYVAGFFSSNILKCDVIENKGNYTLLSCNGVNIITSDSATGKATVSVRPEDIIISKKSVETSARNILHGKVMKIENYGRLVWLTVDFGIPLRVVLTPNSLEALELKEGDEIYGIFKASAVRVINFSQE